MIYELRIQHYALMEEVHVPLESGFTVITGESGSGKSTLLSAFSFLLGARANADMVRTGHNKALVEAVFEDTSDPDEVLVVSRELLSSGKSFLRLNARLSSVSQWKESINGRIELVQQGGSSHFFSSQHLLDLLDRIGSIDHEPYVQTFLSWQHLQRKLQEPKHDLTERQNRLDYLEYQLQEITATQLQEHEETDLEAERFRLSSFAKLERLLTAAHQAMYEAEESSAAMDLLGFAQSQLQEAAHLDPELTQVLDLVEEASQQLAAAVDTLRDYRVKLDGDPERLSFIEERLYTMAQLKRKYRVHTISELLQLQLQWQKEYESLLRADEERDDLLQESEAIYAQLLENGVALQTARRTFADSLAKDIEHNLHRLGMPKAQFYFSWLEKTADRLGLYELVPYFQANAGEKALPLTEVASGGEASRILLALYVAMAAGEEEAKTFFFDEIDAGLSGELGTALGSMLHQLSSNHQVIAISHVPTVAVHADHHLRLTKHEHADRTVSVATYLNKQDRIEEIARMLGGQTELAVAHAVQLLKKTF